MMSPRSKKEYIEVIFLRYKKASRKERTIILNEFCATCGYHRNLTILSMGRVHALTNSTYACIFETQDETEVLLAETI